jgi:ribosomal protein S18 acetylase RimI-like enzyme
VAVRRARPNDAAAIAAVHVRAWQAAYEHVLGADRLAALTAERWLPMWQEVLTDAKTTAFVSETAEGEIVGWCTVRPSSDPDADGEVWGLYAVPEAWGTGAGTELLAAGVAELRAAGCRDASLWVLEDNPRARRFYEREGWASRGERKEATLLGVPVAEVRYRLRLG